ncbi:MAG: FAD-binding protein, partial [Mesorhizobium sp.]
MDEAGVLDAVVVGAGWAGLGVSYALAQADMRHCVLERGRVGETWRTQRWDSFHFNLPNMY